MKFFYRIFFCVLFLGMAAGESFSQGCGITASCNFTTTPVIGKTNIGCYGDSTGQLDLLFYSSGTNYPYCFEWHSGSEVGPMLSSGTVTGVGIPPIPAGSGTITNLPAGTYVLVTYNTAVPNCKNKNTQTIEQPTSVFSATLSSTSPPSCAGTCLNVATADGSGGTPPYYFSWSSGEVDNGVYSSFADSLCTGNYSVTITDDAGCDTLLDFYIDVSPLPLADAGPDELFCNGSSGSTLGGSPTATGGTSPFSYLWTPNGGTLNSDTIANPDATPSATTTYTVTVTDVNNCTGVDNAVITVNPPITISFSQINVSCFGDTSGMAVAIASGGSSPFSYVWNTSPPQANDTAINIPFGTYLVTVTDDSACTEIDSVTITQPVLLSASIATVVISCNGANDGKATAIPSGGTSPYTYLWSLGGQTTPTINSLSPGNYCVTVTDALGCDTTICTTFVDPPAIIPNFTKTNVTCNGLCNGTASVAPTGGTSPFTVVWNPGAFSTALSVSGLCPGNYSVTIFDAGGCNKTTPFVITEPAAIIPNASATDVSCFGNCDGEVTSNPTGGTTPYSYSWSVPSILQTVTGLCPNTYNLTVTDSMGCSKTSTATVGTPTAVLVNLSVSNATCPDFFNGFASVAPSGGVSPYTFVWSDFSTTQPFDTLGSGSYSVTVTDSTGCTATQDFTVTAPPDFSSTLSQTNPSCFGSSNGSACVSTTGGTTPYTYSWSCSGSIISCASGLSAGPCNVTITDFNTCVKTESFVLVEPDSINTVTNQLNQTCSGFCDGVGEVIPIGGVTPYSYLWSVGGQTDSTATGLCGGVNTVTVTDFNGCSTVDTVVISSSVVITITSSIVNEDCNAIGCDGTATATASGGFGPYDFIWSNGDMANDTNISKADSLCAQLYSITATDALGCSSIDSLVMTVADSVLQITDSVIDVTCTGNNDGQAYAVLTGGTGPGTYTYLWSPGGETDSLITGLAPGTYSVLVIDGNLCRDSLSMVVGEPEVLVASITGVNLSCYNSCSGSATASQAGGTSPFTYLWDDGQTTQTATGLCADTISVTVFDVNNCSSSAQVVLTEPPPLSVVMSSTLVSCNGGNNGTATATPSGGISPYTYSWSVPQITQTVTGLSAITYFVTVTDANFCTVTSSVLVSQPGLLSVSVSKTDLMCSGVCVGTATAAPSGGTSPYSYLWSNTQTTQTATGLCSGSYTVTVTDFKGCTKTSSVTIAEPTDITLSTTKTDVTCNGLCDGSSIVSVSGGISPYSYLWSNGQTTAQASGLCSGNNIVTVTDFNGCNDTVSVSIAQPLAITAIPNPSPSNCGVCDGVAKFTISGGTPGYSHSWSTGTSAYPLTFACAAIYTDTITDANGCQLIASVAVSNLNAPDGVTFISSNPTCYGSCDGTTAIIAVSGGNPPFSFLWPDSETDTVMTNICAGSDFLQVTDNLNCVLFETFVMDAPDSLEAGILVVNATCTGLSDGTVISNPSGGSPSYSYEWSTGSSSPTVSGVASGNYPVTITDANGCTVIDTANVGESSLLSLAFGITDVLCNGFATGSLQVTPSGGNPPYSYLWDNGQATATATGLIAGNYFVTITDNNGCSVTGNDTVSEPAPVLISDSVVHATCGLSDGSVTVSASGGSSPYTYSWLNGQTGATATGLAAGTESVIVTDSDLCTDTFNIGVNNISGPGTSASVTNVSCFGACDGTGSVSVSSGVSPFTYLWVPGGQTTASVTGLCAGDVDVEVTDGNNCTTVQTMTVSGPTPITASFSKTKTSCFGSCDGSVTVTGMGGVVPYSYLWNTSATTQFVSGLCAGTYTVTITDANGCSAVASVNIVEPTLLTASATGSAVGCFGNCNGTAMATVSGGTPGYSYSWSSGSGSQIAASLCAGNYVVTVTDASGCTATASATVTQPSDISITAIVISSTCGTCSGTIAISSSGGTGLHTRIWSTGSVAASISGLCPNIYDLTITDANGCTADTSFIINNSDGPLPVLTGDTTSCFNSCDGSATSVTTGGTSPYSFLWDDPSSQTNSSATGLCDGVYGLYVTDSNGCIGIGTTAIEEPAQLSNSFSVVDSDCNSSCDVTVTVVPSGGTSPYTYLWSGGLGTGSSKSNLCSGTFFVTITDDNSCTRIDSVVVDETSTLALTISGSNSNCFNSCDGIASAVVSGGNPPYIYSWSNTAITPVITNLCYGTFILSVTDNNGCLTIDSAVITEPALLNASISGNDAFCYGKSNGSAVVSASGGSTPYSYNWSPSGQTNATATGLFAGIQNVTVTDANGCTFDTSIVLNQPTVLNFDSSSTSNTACGDTSGQATVFVSGGVPPYSYLWSNGDTTQTADSLLQGGYTVVVTFNGSCDTTFGGIVIVNTDIPTVVMNITDIECGGNCTGSVTASVSAGVSPYSFLWSNGQTDSTATGLCAGNYILTVSDGLGCISLSSASVSEPALVVLDSSHQNISCFGANDGSASVVVSGGISPYSYLWNNGAATSSLTGLPAGAYCVTVTDINGCDPSVCVTVIEPAALSLTASFTGVTCFGVCDGKGTASVSGGVSPYSYLWSSGETGPSATALCAGTDSIVIADANGCSVDTAGTVTSPDDIIADSIVVVDASCLTANGSITIFASGGTSPLSYLWSNGDTGIMTDSLLLGVYSVEVTDSLSCSKTFDNIILNNNSGPTVATTVSDILCNGDCNGQVTATASGGMPPYGFAWSTGDSFVFVATSSIDSLCSGVYFVTVVDVGSCGTIVFEDVSDPALLTASVVAGDISCFGKNDGTATATGNGGVSPYTFLWNTGKTSASLDSLSPGNYCVTITDDNGCDTSVCISINEPSLLALSFSSANLSCNSSCDGNATANITGGTSPYSVSWTNGDNTVLADSLCAGTHIVSVTDLNGCVLNDSVTVTEPTAIVSDSVVLVKPACTDSNGTVTIYPSGGFSPYTYLWDASAGNQTSQMATGLSAGTFSVSVSDNTGCQNAFSVNVVNLNAPSVAVLVTDIPCGGFCNGQADATVSGGTLPYTLLWNNADTTNSIDSLCPGIVSITVTDAASCVVVVSDTVDAGTTLNGTMSANNVLCTGDSTGSAMVSVSGGTLPYTYLWTGGQTTFAITGITAGVYCVTVNDAGGCSFSDCDTVFQPDSALLLTVSTAGESCFGSCDGSAATTVSGGITPYSYLWCNGSTASSILGCAITCSVTITDSNGCTETAPAIIAGPSVITLVDSLIPPDCGSSNGSISITASGGVPFSSGYSYQWDAGANNQTTSLATGLGSGTYCVTVTDSTGCSKTSCFPLQTPGNAVVTVDSILNVDCNGLCTGKLSITVTGNSPFTFLWSNGDTDEDPDSLCAGTFYLTITDVFGCISVFDTSVTQPSPLSGAFTTMDAECGVCDGTASIVASGGISPYTYQWSNSDTGLMADSLCAGNIGVTVFDDNGCSSVFSSAISNIGGPDSVVFSSVNLSCFGSCDGSVASAVYGGLPPFTYLWSTGETTSSISWLCAGNYSLSVTDSAGCLSIIAATISQPSLMSSSFTSIPPSCGLANGSITATVSGGTPTVSGYFFEWDSNVPGMQTTATVTGLEAGIFFVTVTDSMGCSGVFNTTLSNSDAFVYTIISDASCNGVCDGSIIADSISGTNTPFTYLWNPTGQTDSSISSLCAGNYILEITDAFGCQAFQSFVISEPTPLAAVFSLTDASCGQCNGQADLTVSGGTSPYTYLWSNNQTTPSSSGLCAGVYSAEITDSNGCQLSASTGISNIGSPIDSVSFNNVSCFGQCDGFATVFASGGVTPYSYFWVGVSPSNPTNSATDLCAGDYFVQITGGNGCINTSQVTIAQPTPLADNSVITPPTCSGNDGSINAVFSGGTTPYDYDWSNGATTALNSGLSAGIYNLILTEDGGAGCSQFFSYILNPASGPQLSVSGYDANCNSLCNGGATVVATGGTPGYTYQWLNSDLSPISGAVDSSINSLCQGVYFAQVIDAISCLSSIQVVIGEPLPLDTSLISSSGALCFGDCNGSATAIVNGGTPPYSYLWNDGSAQATNPAVGLCAGTYSVLVNDANNCSVSQIAVISQPAPVTVDTNSVSDALCFDSNNGAIDVSGNGGTSPYSFYWTGPNSFSSAFEDNDSLLPGAYYVTITDVNSCDTTAIIIVDTTISLILAALPDTVLCEEDSGVVYWGNTYGNGNITYNWVDISTGITLSTDSFALLSPSEGVTSFYLSASIGGFCEVRDSFLITVNPTPDVDAGSGSTVVKGVSAAIGGSPTATGGNPPYSYIWSPEEGLDDPLLSNPVALPSATSWYFVTVTTADGCSAYDSVDVTVVPLIEYISGFSPNGDGINETWEIDYVEQFPGIVVEIYNRWGQLLFHSEGYKDPWDGTFNGKPLPIGTYYYVIELNHPRFPEPISGPVTIVK